MVAQARDTAVSRRDSLATVRVTATRLGPLPTLQQIDASGTRVGRRTEVIDPSLAGTPVLNNTRQAFARSPGVMVWEQDMSGVQSSVAVRGLSPNRSWELNTRQDGADIASDPFGYPEAYYTPPLEAVDRIEFIRGAASLQHGPQLGGMLNYVMRRGRADAPFALDVAQRGGTGGLYTAHVGAGGQAGRLNWYAFFNGRQGDGWRQLGEFRQGTAAVRADLAVSERTTLRASATRMDYVLRQPGGLSEAQFAADARQGRRPRDWFGAPWTIPHLTLEHRLGPATHLHVSGFGLYGERNSIGVIAGPAIADSGTNPRRVDRDAYRNAGLEARVVHGTTVAGRSAALVAGLRASTGRTTRMRARGAEGGSFVLDEAAPRSLDLVFDTRNAAAFAELSLEVAPGFLLSPGLRVERIAMTGAGQWAPASGTTFLVTGPARPATGARTSTVALGGLGLSWRAPAGLEVYGNVAQAFRPVTFAEQFPNDLVAVDPALGPARGVNADLGVRRAVSRTLTFDVSAFWLRYADRIGVVSGAALGADSLRFPAGLRRNVGQSTHYGLEAFGELDLSALAGGARLAGGSVSWWTATSRTVASFTGGPLRGRQVEYAPGWIVRSGLSWRAPGAHVSLQGSYVDGVWSDAANTRFRADGVQGWIPAYRVVDASVRVPLVRGVAFEGSVHNLLDARYATRRATGYPGPGLVPGDGRVVVAGLVVGR
ncbi:MAG: TonB-dependent receptor family protein [Gemmatimonadota bacterium]